MTPTLLLILALTFAAAGLAKLRAPDPFRAALRKLLPAPVVGPATTLLPISELALSLWLLTNLTPRAAALTAAAVLILFTLTLLKMHRLGLEGCGCFGEQAEGTGFAAAITRNLLLLTAAIYSALHPTPHILSPTPSDLLAQLTLVVGAVCLWSCVSALAARRKWITQRSAIP